MKLTNSQSKWLAEFSGGKLVEEECRGVLSFPDDEREDIWFEDFNPYTNWNHLRLLIEALEAKFAQDTITIRLCRAWIVDKVRLDISSEQIATGKDLPEAVITAALAVKEDK